MLLYELYGLFLVYLKKTNFMDTLSHWLYWGLIWIKKNKKSFWLSFLFWMLPDLLAFAWFFPVVIFKYWFIHSGGHPPPDFFPYAVHFIYNCTHSLVLFWLLFWIVWFINKKPMYELLAWLIHILMDIPTHTAAFFPTKFLYPISDYYINWISWWTSWIFFSYVWVLVFIYWFMFFKKKIIVRN